MDVESNIILCGILLYYSVFICSGLCVTLQVWIQSLFLEFGFIITTDGLYGNWQLWNLLFLRNLLIDA
jgi:hypothetical protein